MTSRAKAAPFRMNISPKIHSIVIASVWLSEAQREAISALINEGDCFVVLRLEFA